MYNSDIKVKDSLHSDCLLHDVIGSMAREGKIFADEAQKFEDSLYPSLEGIES